MSQVNRVYKCDKGTLVEIVIPGQCEGLECCGEPMAQLEEQTADAANEKHVPVIEKQPGGYLVKVGSVAHPMLDAHYIQFIELHTADMVYRKYLKPGDASEAFFEVKAEAVWAREYCNIHGLWKG